MSCVIEAKLLIVASTRVFFFSLGVKITSQSLS